MRILHVVESLNPKLGGPSVCAPSLACTQAMQGDEVTILSYADTQASSSDLSQHLSSLPHIESVQFTYLPARDRYEAFFASHAAQWFDLNIKNYDVVHLHGLWRPIVARAASSCYRSNCQYVLQPHGMLDPWSMSQKQKKKAIVWRLTWKAIANRSAFLHVLTHTEAASVRKLGVTAPLAIVGNGIFRKHLELIADFPNDMPDEPYILFFSRLHPKKGLDLLAAAYRIYRKKGGVAKLRVVGPEEGAGPAFTNAIQRTGLSAYVTVEPPVYGEKKYALMRKAACFCLPSYQEGFSVALLEAAACAIPLVITSACNFPEIAEADAGRVVSESPDEIADALLLYTRSGQQELRLSAGARGQRLVSERYTWEAVASQLRNHYLATIRKAIP